MDLDHGTGFLMNDNGRCSCCVLSCPQMARTGGQGLRYNRQLHQPRVWPGLLARRVSGPARGFQSRGGLKAAHCFPLELGAQQTCGGARARGGRVAMGLRLRAGSPPRRSRWGGAIPGWQLTSAADFGGYTPAPRKSENRKTPSKTSRPPGGPPLVVTPQLNGGPTRRAVNKCM